MASRNGKANVTPAPLSTVLRERCFFVMNMSSPIKPNKKHRDTKTQRHKENAALDFFVCCVFFVPLCLCVSVFSLLLRHSRFRSSGRRLFAECVGINDA